jgi:hypothetical protein
MKSKYLMLIALLPGLMLASCSPKSATPADAPKDSSAAPAADSTAAPAAPAADSTAAPAEGSGTATEAPAAPAASAEKEAEEGGEWVSLFNGKDLEGWTPRGEAVWEVKDGVMIGRSPGKQGHIYAGPELTDLEVKGVFRITEEGKSANSGLYFRANPPKDNINGYPEGYEAQICNSQEAHTGWLWKPGKGVGKASKLLTKDGEWFAMRVKAVGTKIEIFINDELVTTFEDAEYTKGFFALQCHNSGMVAEAKDLYYRDLSKK